MPMQFVPATLTPTTDAAMRTTFAQMLQQANRGPLGAQLAPNHRARIVEDAERARAQTLDLRKAILRNVLDALHLVPATTDALYLDAREVLHIVEKRAEATDPGSGEGPTVTLACGTVLAFRWVLASGEHNPDRFPAPLKRGSWWAADGLNRRPRRCRQCEQHADGHAAAVEPPFAAWAARKEWMDAVTPRADLMLFLALMREPDCHEPRRIAETMFRLALVHVLDQRVADPDISRAILRGECPDDYDRWCTQLTAAGVAPPVPGSLLAPEVWATSLRSHIMFSPRLFGSCEEEPDDAYDLLPRFLSADVGVAVADQVGR